MLGDAFPRSSNLFFYGRKVLVTSYNFCNANNSNSTFSSYNRRMIYQNRAISKATMSCSNVFNRSSNNDW